MNIQFKKGVLELCVLSTLAHKDCYGYELVQTLSAEIKISEGTIYPLLRRLKKDGYVKTYLQESSGGPPRKYYSLTDEGSRMEQTLKNEWLRFVQAVEHLIEGGGLHEQKDISQ